MKKHLIETNPTPKYIEKLQRFVLEMLKETQDKHDVLQAIMQGFFPNNNSYYLLPDYEDFIKTLT